MTGKEDDGGKEPTACVAARHVTAERRPMPPPPNVMAVLVTTIHALQLKLVVLQ